MSTWKCYARSPGIPSGPGGKLLLRKYNIDDIHYTLSTEKYELLERLKFSVEMGLGDGIL